MKNPSYDRHIRLDPTTAGGGAAPAALSPALGAGGPRPMSAGLSRRLAAAADGHRNGAEIYFRARFEPGRDGDFELSGPFTRDEAMRIQVPDGFGIFGPYRTERCDDDISQTPIRRITIELNNGDKHVFAGNRFDALFWSASALEKFVIPHYSIIGGLGKAQRLHDTFLQTDVFLIAHDPNTEETLISVKPNPRPVAP